MYAPVSVYAGTDPLTGRRHYLRENIPAGPNAHAEAQKAMRHLANQVDERWNPRTNATVDQLLDRHFELAELETNTLATSAAWPKAHPAAIGSVKVGRSTAICSTAFVFSLAVDGSVHLKPEYRWEESRRHRVDDDSGLWPRSWRHSHHG